MFKKRNLVSKLWLKYTDRRAYKDYKWDLVNYRQFQFTNFLTGADKLNDPDKIKKAAAARGRLALSHSGNAGDIIYALPTIKKIHEITGVPVHLYLRLGRPLDLPLYSAHPVGSVMLNEKMATMLFGLLRVQPYIDTCELHGGQPIDIDLDYFRSGLIPMGKGNIARWCSYITGVTPDLWQQWLFTRRDDRFSDSIVIARSGRYQNKSIDFSFLNQYANLKFIGVKSEFDQMKAVLPALEWVEMGDFLQMAETIAGCKFFIGNQSFPYAVAEALKVPRILETAFEVIDVVPEGPGGHDFFFQEHFEWLVKDLDARDR